MRATLFKPKRRGKESRHYVLRVHPRPGLKPLQIPLHVSLKENAEKRKREILLEMEKEQAGLLPPKPLREAAQQPLRQHLEQYAESMEQRGRAPAHIRGEKNRLDRIFSGCQWKTPADIKRDAFERWLCSLKHCTAKTRNDYLSTARTFANWLVKMERLAFNPLAGVEKAKVKGNESKTRRAYTREEVERLLAVSGPRAIVYRMAIGTGLRRGELMKLEWRDLDLHAEKPSVRVRATTTKNGKQAKLPLNPELAEYLRAFRPADAKPMDRVFKGLINRKIEPFHRDLKAAGIAYVDANGETADFHSFRHTFITWLVAGKASSREVMALARLSEERLLNWVYTDARHLQLEETIQMLPSLAGNDSPYYSPKSGPRRPALSKAVQKNSQKKKSQVADSESVVPDFPGLSSPVVAEEMVRGAGFEPATPTMSR